MFAAETIQGGNYLRKYGKYLESVKYSNHFCSLTEKELV